MALLCKSPLKDARVEKALHYILIHNKWDRGLSLFAWAAKIGMTPETWVTLMVQKGRQEEEKAQEAGTRHLELDKNKTPLCKTFDAWYH